MHPGTAKELNVSNLQLTAMTESGTQSLGAYRLIAKIGAGGMGEVWKAEDTRLGRIVAIKILPPAVVADPQAGARLRREARTAAQLHHPNIATIHSLEEDGERLFIVMEYVEGEPLSALMRRGPLPESEVCRIGRGVAEALADAHAKGIVHRDVKPDNIIVTPSRVKVLDFGIAKQVGVISAPSDATTAFVTQHGMIVGTIHYMSPEQALGKSVDARTDLFSLGVVLYEAATGRLPFAGETVTETMTNIIRDEPLDPQRANPRLSAGLATIIRRCLQKRQEDRFADAGALAAALEGQLGKAATEPYENAATMKTAVRPLAPAPPTMIEPRRKSRALPIALLLLAVVIAGGVLWRMRTRPLPQPAPVVVTTTNAPATTTTARPPEPAPMIVEAKPLPATPPEPAPPAPAPARVAQPPIDTTPPADSLYAEGMAQVREGRLIRAHEAFARAVQADPRHARAHLRLAEMALLTRQQETALGEYRLALENGERLDERERAIAGVGAAVAERNRGEAHRLAAEFDARWPDDVELRRIAAAYPGMFGLNDRGPRRRRF
jgi:tetratricopeptide (TPR) repeat protein/predicted Ser/Thr protein kinase